MQFENRYVSNEKIYGEYTRKVLFRGLDRMAMVIFVLAAMLFAFAKKKETHTYLQKIESGDDLLSRAVASQVPSAC